MRTGLRFSLCSLAMLLAAGAPAQADTSDELAALLPDTLDGMARTFVRTDPGETAAAIAEYDATGDGQGDLEVHVIDLGGYADAVRFRSQVHAAEGRIQTTEIAGREAFLNDPTIADLPMTIVVVGRVAVIARPYGSPDIGNHAAQARALGALDFSSLETWSAAAAPTDGRPDLPWALPLTPSFMLPAALAGMAANPAGTYRPRFSNWGGPAVEGYRYEVSDGGPGIIAMAWDMGSHAADATRLIAARAEREGWTGIEYQGYAGYLTAGPDPRLYLQIERYRLSLESVNGGPDLVAALADIDLLRFRQFAAINPALKVLIDPEMAAASPVDPAQLEAAVAASFADFTRVEVQSDVQTIEEFRGIVQRVSAVQANYESGNGVEIDVQIFDPGLTMFANGSLLEFHARVLSVVDASDRSVLLGDRRGRSVAWIDVDGRFGLVFIAARDTSEEALLDAALAFPLGPIAALGGADAPDGTALCADESCFQSAFAACTQARFRTPRMMGAVAEYEILEPAAGGCRVSLVYTSNPNPDWVGKPLEMTLPVGGGFIDTFMAGFQACLDGNAPCSGPLLAQISGSTAPTPAPAPVPAGMTDVVLVLDVSNSMWGRVEGRPKIEIAREVVAELIGEWNPATNLGLVAYGHRREGDCTDIEAVIPVGPVDTAAFINRVNGLTPRGKTPLSKAVLSAATALSYTDRPATVILVSDGIESCNADPCELSQALEKAGVAFTAHVIGFDVADPTDQAQLSCIAENTGGRFYTASNADELGEALRAVAAPAPAPEPVIDALIVLEAVEAEGGPAMASPDLRWTLVGLDSEESVLTDAAGARHELRLDAGRYFARATLGAAVGDAQFEVIVGEDAVHQVVLSVAASLEAPDEVAAGSAFEVAWDGPDGEGDQIIVALEGNRVTYPAYTGDGNPLTLTAPGEPGEYELQYVMAGTGVVAQRPLTVVPLEIGLEFPPSVVVGSDFDVTWSGPGNDNDTIVVALDGSRVTYPAYPKSGNPLTLTAPPDAGAYEVWYVVEGKVAGRAPLEVTAAGVSLSFPGAVPAGSAFDVSWIGPANKNDTIIVTFEGSRVTYPAYPHNGNPLSITAPGHPGAYEVWYVIEGEPAERAPLEVSPASASVSHPPAVQAGADFDVSWTGPANDGDTIIVTLDGNRITYPAYPREGSPLTITAPKDPGSYEVRYVLGADNVVIARSPLTVTAR